MGPTNEPSREELLARAGIGGQIIDDFAPDALAPPVDEPRILALLAGSLDEVSARITWHRIVSFRPWRDAYLQLLRAQSASQLKPTQTDGQSTSDEAAVRKLEVRILRPKWRHYGPLIALAAAALVAVGVFLWGSRNGSGLDLVARLNDAGGVVAIDQEGNLSGLESVPQEWREEAKEVLLAQAVVIPGEVQEFIGRDERIRSGPTIELVYPVATAIQNDQPTVRWRPVNGVESYTVAVLNLEWEPIAESATITQLEWTLPDPLQRGRVYIWRVTPVRNSNTTIPLLPSPGEAKFKVLETEKIEELRQFRTQFPGAHLVLGIMYARAGLLDEAERELQLLVGANPESTLANKLLDSLRQVREPQE